MAKHVIDEVKGFYRIIELKPFRRTEGVSFDIVPMDLIPRIDGIDRVVHMRFAISPSAVGDVERPWYMHPYQEDNLLVLQGSRSVDIFTMKYGRMESFIVEPERIVHNGEVVYKGPAMLVWPCGVFHRITTGEEGSASLNFAARFEGFDVRTNFNVYDLDMARRKTTLLRAGYQDQNPA
ncbi:MAG: hypothetical protein CVV47_00140 [Spirochaetae bacterium HGW-Spirochaetae-3]|jgi:hypothetical protein|nr:MAG: hypothetical protein CVV47_00140 [Spirochaetae bacterium HGW-Spirochaetae-3]